MEKITVDGEICTAYTIPTTNASMLMINSKCGMLACGYIKVETADKLGVNNYEQMLEKPVVAASIAAQALGVRIGMSGREALLCMR